MNVKLVKCPSCSAPIRIEDSNVQVFSCKYCGHSGIIRPENIYEKPEASTSGIKYSVDIVMVIDATGSMKPVIQTVKSNALRFYDDLIEAMSTKHKIIDSLRIRLIQYRDFFSEGSNAMTTSEFFTLPTELKAFSSWVNNIDARGGGELPESGLEAVVEAINSNWTQHVGKKRHIIVLWTDSSTQKLERAQKEKPKGYPENMPKDMNELTDLWESHPVLKPSTKRLILYAPELYAWNELSDHWSNTIHFPSEAGRGLNTLDYRTILDSIANSV